MIQKILVVDDEPMLTDLLDAHLTQRGYLVCKATNAEEALGTTGTGDVVPLAAYTE